MENSEINEQVVKQDKPREKFEIGERVIHSGVAWHIRSVVFDNMSRIYRYKLEPVILGNIKWVREDEIEYND